jgi:hypothetical protein
MQKKVDPFLGHRWKDLTLEELAIIIDGKILFKEQMEKVAERVRKIGLPTLPKEGN